MLSLELTYRVITAEFERSSNISPNNCEREINQTRQLAMHQSNMKQDLDLATFESWQLSDFRLF